MVSALNYLKAKKLNNNKVNNDNNNKNNDNNDNKNDTYPTITIIDSLSVPYEDEPIRKRCFIIPERAFVAVIFSLNLFFGILITAGAFTGLSLSSDPSTQAQYAVYGISYAFLALTGIIGLTALRKENAILMRRLSISFWILTALLLIFNVTSYIVRIITKPEYVQSCQTNLNQLYSQDQQKELDLSCDRIVNYSLIRYAFQLLLVEAISIYFAYAVACYSKKLLSKLKFDNQKHQGNDVFTYKIQTTNPPPTSDSWVPPNYGSDNKI